MKKAVILLSGGLDSATCLAIAKDNGYAPYALSFRYGQRHEFELDSARAVAKALGTKDHVILDIDLRIFGGSALTDEIEVPKDRCDLTISNVIPVTYVPARNTIQIVDQNILHHFKTWQIWQPSPDLKENPP